METADPAMSPERAAALRGQLTGVATALLDAVLAGLEGPSTGSLQERAVTSAIRPFLPSLRSAFLNRLSEADPVLLERLMGATSTAIESILFYAPGDPQPRWVFDWTPDGLAIHPLDPPDAA